MLFRSVRGSTRIEDLEVRDLLQSQGAPCLMVWGEILQDGEAIGRTLGLFCRPKDLALHDPGLRVDAVTPAGDGAFAVTVSTEKPALWAWLSMETADLRCSDNFFCMRPGAPRELLVSPSRPGAPDVMAKRLRLASLYDLSGHPGTGEA